MRSAFILMPTLIFMIVLQLGCGKSFEVQDKVEQSDLGSNGNVEMADASVMARVLIKGNLGQPVAGVQVQAQWSGAISGVTTAITGADGYAELTSPKSKAPGLYKVQITNVSKAGLTYEASKNKIDQASIVR